jgi:hypothetical protein
MACQQSPSAHVGSAWLTRTAAAGDPREGNALTKMFGSFTCTGRQNLGLWRPVDMHIYTHTRGRYTHTYTRGVVPANANRGLIRISRYYLISWRSFFVALVVK